MHNDTPRVSWRRLLYYMACYTLWIAFSALGIWIVLQLRTDIAILVMVLGLGPWVLYVADKWSIFLLGLFWLGGVVLLEHYLRNGMQKNRLWIRARRVFLFEAIVLGVSYEVQFLLT